MKLILSERELEIIKQQEYKRGWNECDLAHATRVESIIKKSSEHINDAANYLGPKFEGWVQTLYKPSLATAEFRHEHGFLRNVPEPGTITEELIHVAKNEDGTISLGSGEYRIVNGEWYKVKKLQESNPLPRTCCSNCNEEWRLCSCKQESCQHESDGFEHRVLTSPHAIHKKYKCIKCGEFY